MIHPLFEKWLGVKAVEYSKPFRGDELLCLTAQVRKDLKPKGLTTVTSEMGAARVEKARKRLAALSADERREALRDDWGKLLGPIAPGKAVVKSAKTETTEGVKVERVVLEVEPGIVVPLLVLSPEKAAKKAPVVIGLAHAGKAGFLKERSAEIDKLVAGGAVFVLPDLRGIGETGAGASRGRDSRDTDQSVHVQLFGETLLGQRLRDLRCVMAYLRTRSDLDGKRITLWGDSFAPRNSEKTRFEVPHGVDGWPTHAEPLGGLLGLLGALYEDVHAVFVSGGLTSYRSVLGHFAVLVPHGDCVPGALTAGDLCDLAGAIALRPLHLENVVDHLNRPASEAVVRKEYAPTIKSYADRPKALSFSDKQTSAAAWILRQLQ
jgi:hypothetical protein